MSLLKKPAMTRKRVAANRANGKRSRQLLENILKPQMDLCKEHRKALLRESLAGPSPYERAAEITLAHPNTALMQRMEECSFRQIWRITTLLLKMKRQLREEEPGSDGPQTRNVYEKKHASKNEGNRVGR